MVLSETNSYSFNLQKDSVPYYLAESKKVVYSDFKKIDIPAEAPTKPTPSSFKNYSIQEVTQLAGVKNIPIEKICDGYKIESLDVASQELLNKIYNALLKK